MTDHDDDDIYPTELQLKQAEEMLYVTWSDGHKTPFTLSYIRGWCPCAKCQGHFTRELHFQESVNPVLEDVTPVGNYGMKLTWGDGHDSGIYSFDELRSICTCQACDPQGERTRERVRPRYH